MGHSKNNEANVLQNGQKSYIWYISNVSKGCPTKFWEIRYLCGASLSHHCRINSLHAIFLSCLIIFGMTHINVQVDRSKVWHMAIYMLGLGKICSDFWPYFKNWLNCSLDWRELIYHKLECRDETLFACGIPKHQIGRHVKNRTNRNSK